MNGIMAQPLLGEGEGEGEYGNIHLYSPSLMGGSSLPYPASIFIVQELRSTIKSKTSFRSSSFLVLANYTSMQYFKWETTERVQG